MHHKSQENAFKSHSIHPKARGAVHERNSRASILICTIRSAGLKYLVPLDISDQPKFIIVLI